MTQEAIDKAAEALLSATRDGILIPPVRQYIGETDIAAAYQVQEVLTANRLAEGARIIGRKIGLTSEAVQQQLGVEQPDFGILFDDMEVLMGAEIPYDQLSQPKAEAEIAFVMRKALPESNITIPELIDAVDYCLGCIEIVGSRVENWDIKITDTIADNASASHFVLGHRPVSLANIDLIKCKMKMYRNGEKVAKGRGSACLGSPLTALHWLAKKLAEIGRPLQAGEIVLSGALGSMVSVEPGDHISTNFDMLGEVSVRFGEK